MKKPFFILLIFSCLFNFSHAKNQNNILKSDQVQVNKWNAFSDELHKLHINLIKDTAIYATETTGGYGGGFANKEFYREISYFNKNTNQLISKIQWETLRPDTIHSIEVYLYNNKGQVKTDFYARFLPYARNAPVQTLINLHNYNDDLHSFRQFDANNELIYETCRGQFFDHKINLHLDNEEIMDFRNTNSDEMLDEAYNACFLNVAKTANNYLHPGIFMRKSSNISQAVDNDLDVLSELIKVEPDNPKYLVQRGELYFRLHDFHSAIKDYNKALSINPLYQQAYFSRGMALARNGQIDEGIKDLSVFIKSNPQHSIAYTKRGVRYIWAGKLDLAKRDLIKAVTLDKSNAEAHDDLGVLYAQQRNFTDAMSHFFQAIQHDPSYQKAYHNLAIVYLLTNKASLALNSVNKALFLNNDSRNSLMLKSEILMALGKAKDAETIMRKAEFLPEGNWSERFEIKQ